jgi:hypothetical protein
MPYIAHYTCKKSKSGYSDGNYSIDFADEKQIDFAIWINGMWAWATFKSQRSAYHFLKEEFETIKKHEE